MKTGRSLTYLITISGVFCIFIFASLKKDKITYGDGVTDIDGNEYKSVIIGNQEWMAENLKTTRYSDGRGAIPNVPKNSDWSNLSTGAYAWYDNDAGNGATYGALYNGHAVKTGNLCPAGWHVPTNEEWRELFDYLSANRHKLGTRGDALKAKFGWNSWYYAEGTGNDDYGFSALPGGARPNFGTFEDIGYRGYWWSSTEYDDNNAWYMFMRYIASNISMNASNLNYGISVRCLKNAD